MANIDSKLNAIKSAIYGADVRTSIADGIETINTEVESTTAKQKSLEDTFEDLVINAGNSNAEIVVARSGEVDLATKIGKIDSSLSDKATKVDLGNKSNLPTVDKTSFEKSFIELYNLLLNKLSKAQIQSLIGFADINKNLSQIDSTMLTSELLAMIAGTAGVNVTPSALSVLTGMLADKSVSPDKTNFIDISTNIHNKATDSVGYSVSSDDGTLRVSEMYNASDFIEVTPLTDYYFYGYNAVAFYNASQQFIARPSLNYTGTKETTTAVTFFIKVHYQPSVIYQRQINKSDTLLPYEEYYKKLSSNIEVTLKNNAVSTTNVTDSAITSIKRTRLGELPIIVLSVMTSVPNLDLVNSKIVFESNFIIINRNVRYAITGGVTLDYGSVLTDKSMKLIYFDTSTSTFSFHASTDLSLVTEDMIIFAVVYRNSIDWSLNINCEYTINSKPRFMPYTTPETDKTYKFSIEKLTGDYPFSDLLGIGEVGSPFNYTDDNHTLVYSLFDSLMTANPDYITRTQIGTVTGDIPIYKYSFNPVRPIVDGYALKPLPKILLGASIHGGENLGVATLYYLFKRICEEWHTNTQLEYLRFNINFVVVPLQNPIDYNNKEYIRASTGINMNRNFDWHWSESVSTDKGTSAMSEIETQIMSDFWVANNDAIHYIDCHVRGGMQTVIDRDIIWLSQSSQAQAQFGSNNIERMTRRWKVKYPQLPNIPFYGICTVGTGYTNARGYAQNVVGIQSTVWEGFSRSTTFQTQENNDVVNMNVDSLGQYVMSVIKNYQE